MKERWMLRGQRALITGGTRGIGHATANCLLDLGAEVLVVGRDASRAEEIRAAWAREGRAGDVVVADLTTPEGRAAAVAAASARWHSLEALVNNVGEGNRKAFVDVTDDDIDALVRLN